MIRTRAAAVLAFFAASALGATTAPAAPLELNVSASSGLFAAGGRAYRQLYGGGVPFCLDAWLALGRRFGAAAGLGFLSDSGTAVPLDGGGDEYPLKFKRLTIPFSIYYEAHAGRSVDLRLGAGVGIHRYTEEWPTTGVEASGWKTSPRLYVSAGWRALPAVPRLAFVGTIVFDTIRIKSGSALADKPDIGGFQFLVGASYRLF